MTGSGFYLLSPSATNTANSLPHGSHRTRVGRRLHIQRCEAITAGEVWLPNTVSILVRYTNKIHDRQRITWNDSTYRIESFNASKKDGSATIIATKIDEGTEKGG